MNSLTPVKVVVPIYRTTLSACERISLEQVCRVLQGYPLVFVKPESLDLSAIQKEFPLFGTESFADEYFRGIEGYNRLMLSPGFYRRFADADYVLICQLDAYIFRDELAAWCAKGYDYVGAPWLVRPLYKHPLMKLFRHLWRDARTKATDFKVGNGGLSLRRVAKHIEATERLETAIADYLSHPGKHFYNEDVFFSIEVNRHGMDFKYPDYMEALQFSFDKYPALCYELNGGKLPFGCHSWYKKRMKKFWFPIINP